MSDDPVSEGISQSQTLMDNARKNAAYNALNKVYGPIAGDPDLAVKTASAQTAMANAPLVQAANQAKAAALTSATDQYGPQAADPAAMSMNQQTGTAASAEQRQAGVRALLMLGNTAGADGAINPASFDSLIGANADKLGIPAPVLAGLKQQLTSPNGAQHIPTLTQALLAPTKVTGATAYGTDADGNTVAVTRDQYGNPIQQSLGGTQVVAQQRIPIAQQNANAATRNAGTNAAKLPILQQNANTAAYSANTRSNNSNFGNPNGLTGGGGAPATGAANTHVGNTDGSATTPAFDKLAPVGSKARASAIGAATQIVNQDTQLQNTNNVVGQVQKQLTPYTTGTGSLLKDLPGSAQANLKANLQSLKASGQMAWIASLKNASGQTGIGRVLQSEAKNAETIFGNMEQDQTAKQLALHLQLFQQTVNQLHGTAQRAFKAQWGQDPYALVGETPGKGGAGGTPELAPDLKAAYKKYGL